MINININQIVPFQYSVDQKKLRQPFNCIPDTKPTSNKLSSYGKYGAGVDMLVWYKDNDFIAEDETDADDGGRDTSSSQQSGAATTSMPKGINRLSRKYYQSKLSQLNV